MTREYIVATGAWSPVYHSTNGNGKPVCGADASGFAWATEEQIDNKRLCKQCKHVETGIDDTDREILAFVETQWATSSEIGDHVGLLSNAIRHRLLELYRMGELNRREKPTGQRGYQYSQREPEQVNAGYQGNDQLFESMLNGD